jgi:hypothetical protein
MKKKKIELCMKFLLFYKYTVLYTGHSLVCNKLCVLNVCIMYFKYLVVLNNSKNIEKAWVKSTRPWLSCLT